MKLASPNLNTHTFSTSTSSRYSSLMTRLTPTPTSRRHPPNDRGFDKCAVQSWAAVHGEIKIMSTMSFINEDKYQYLDSSLKHAQKTHTCLMVLHTNVQQSPGSHFAVVDSGTSMHILQYRLFTSKFVRGPHSCLWIQRKYQQSNPQRRLQLRGANTKRKINTSYRSISRPGHP